jgi:hypothetical protein
MLWNVIIVTWFHKNVYQGMIFLNLAKAFAIFFSVNFLWSILVHKNQGIKQSPPADPHAGERLTYDAVLPRALKGLFADSCHHLSAMQPSA